MNECNEILLDQDMKTNISGIFAAGNFVSKKSYKFL